MRRSCATRSSITVLGSAGAAAAIMLLASCGDRAPAARQSDAATRDTTLPGSGNPDFADAAADLQAAFNRKPDPASGALADGAGPARSRVDAPPKRPIAPETKVYSEPAPAALGAPMPAGLNDLASRRDELVQATARTLRAWTDAGGDPTLAGVQYAALSAFPGARPPALPSTWLDSDQRRSADAIAGLMQDLAAQGSRGLDSATTGALLAQRATDLGYSPGSAQASPAVVQVGPAPTTSVLTVPTVALCRRVESFGVYEPVTSTTLQAGRQHTMIVYTEVEGFEQRAAASGDGGFTSELSQTVMLYHDADGLLAWTRPEVTVKDATRRLRRDFYLVQRLELPSTLTIGKYNLKVRVRDGLTGAEAETTLPISVVASAPQR